jgi:hypothetical protein
MDTRNDNKASPLVWVALLLLFGGLLGIYLAARANNYVAVLIGIASLAAVVWYFARRGRKYYEAHPKEATEAKVLRDAVVQGVRLRGERDFEQTLFLIAPLLPFLALLLIKDAALVPPITDYLDSLPNNYGNGLLLAVSLAVVFGIRLWRWKVRRDRAARAI